MATCCSSWMNLTHFHHPHHLITLILRVLEAVARKTCFFHVRTANTSVEVRSSGPHSRQPVPLLLLTVLNMFKQRHPMSRLSGLSGLSGLSKVSKFVSAFGSCRPQLTIIVSTNSVSPPMSQPSSPSCQVAGTKISAVSLRSKKTPRRLAKGGHAGQPPQICQVG